MFGFLNVYKPKGMTSHDVVAVLRRVTKIKQIGHTGTLDPFAEGVLPICIGKSTRLIEYLNNDKAYLGTIQFGSSTDTYDIEGAVIKSTNKIVTSDEIEDGLKNFKGEVEQKPPIYSAIKIKGKKLYEYARAGNENIEIPIRKVIISKLELQSFDFQKQQAEIYIECSKGTYIRSIANDLGEKLGCGGHLIKLIRTKAGKFTIENSTKLEDFENVDDVEKGLINPLNYLDYPKYELSQTEKSLISNGSSIQIDMDDGITILTSNGTISAIGFVKSNTFKCSKVFI